jgi:glycosyltransferase involved in cell wall biosynthesis
MQSMRVVFWGTYDTGKPRVRILLRGLRENGVDVLECHSDIWEGIEDKSRISGLIVKLKLIVKWLLSYPSLILRYLRLPRHDAVIVGYLGQLDVLVLWPFAKLRGVPVIWDAFLSLYNTVVEDRKLVGSRYPPAVILYAWEWLACRASDIVLLDTRAHAEYFVRTFKIPTKKTEAVFVGTETDFFTPQKHLACSAKLNETLKILFYGQFIPLHGIETIILAAQQLKKEPIQWILIGKGQEDSKIRGLLNEHPLPNLNWIPWVPYKELIEWIHRADICLGIFGDSEKASLVIPNKVFQVLSSGKPLITRDSPAIRELLSPDMPGVFLVPAANVDAVIRALNDYASKSHSLADQVLHRSVIKLIEPAAIGRRLIGLLNETSGFPLGR